jgi:uncharacterized membrane protein YcaP (DUF421 family)
LLRFGDAIRAITLSKPPHLVPRLMFDLSLPWWEPVVRAAAIYVALLLFVRLSGKRTVGQFTPFDLLVVMLLSEGVSSGLTGGDESVTGGLLIAATLIGLNGLAAVASARSAKLDAILAGVPVLLARDGKTFQTVLLHHRVSEGDFQKALREADCSMEDMESAVLEADGNISIAKRR